MVQRDKLRELITKKRKSVTYVASELGITRQGFYRKLNKKSSFNEPEIDKLIMMFGSDVWGDDKE